MILLQRGKFMKIILKRFLTFLILITCSYDCCEAKNIFIEAKNATEMQDILSKADLGNAVVVFDIDLVLMVLDTYAFSSCSFKSGLGEKLNDKILKACNGDKNSEKYKNFMSKLLYDTTLVNVKLPKIIKDLQNKGVKVIAHTSRDIGKYGAVACQEDLMIQQLKNLGIDFSEAFDGQEIIIDNVRKIAGKPYPIFKKGILFSGIGWYSKGEVQKALYQKIGWDPKHVVFIDDHDKHLHSVGEEMGSVNVPVTGVHYTEVESRKCSEDAYKNKRANFQVDQLIKTNKWISDKEANTLLQ